MIHYPDFLERHLGRMGDGFSDQSARRSGLSIAVFTPWEDGRGSLFVTLGLSHHTLGLPTGKATRQEFCLFVPSWRSYEACGSFALNFCDLLLQKHWALLQDERIGPYEHYFPGTEFDGILVSKPSSIGLEIDCYVEAGESIEAWLLVPITPDEWDGTLETRRCHDLAWFRTTGAAIKDAGVRLNWASR
ncbi:MAG: suppressor of fused domain protein [Betaproteobacteria bacterium]|nr:suppressor of fused domain protein [Betaproteobacteria bacterium]